MKASESLIVINRVRDGDLASFLTYVATKPGRLADKDPALVITHWQTGEGVNFRATIDKPVYILPLNHAHALIPHGIDDMEDCVTKSLEVAQYLGFGGNPR